MQNFERDQKSSGFLGKDGSSDVEGSPLVNDNRAKEVIPASVNTHSTTNPGNLPGQAALAGMNVSSDKEKSGGPSSSSSSSTKTQFLDVNAHSKAHRLSSNPNLSSSSSNSTLVNVSPVASSAGSSATSPSQNNTAAASLVMPSTPIASSSAVAHLVGGYR